MLLLTSNFAKIREKSQTHLNTVTFKDLFIDQRLHVNRINRPTLKLYKTIDAGGCDPQNVPDI